MVHTLMRKPDTSWPEDSIATASTKDSLNQPLCQDSLKINDDFAKPPSEQFSIPYKSIFNDKQEEELVNYIKKMNEIFFGLSKEDICSLAYKFAENKRIEHQFKNESAGDQWYSNFVARYPEIIWELSEKNGLEATNESLTEHFFHKLKLILKKYKFPPSHMYTVGELCIRQATEKIPHIVSAEDARQLLSENVKNEALVTTVFCCSAVGNFIPPAVILPDKNRVELLCDSICFKSTYGCNSSDIFLEWLKFFIETIRPSEDKKVLLILENHLWYKSTEIFDYAAINNVIIFSPPRSCCKELHPLCLSVFEFFKHNFHEMIEKWSTSHSMDNLGCNLNQIFLEAYLKSVKLHNAIEGFEKSGILKCHRDVSAETDSLSDNIDHSDGSSFLEENFSLIKREKFNFLWNDLQKKAEARRTRKTNLPLMAYSLRNRKYKVKNYPNKDPSKKYDKVSFKSTIQTRRSKLSCINGNDAAKSKPKPCDEIKTDNDESVIQVVYELEIDF